MLPEDKANYLRRLYKAEIKGSPFRPIMATAFDLQRHMLYRDALGVPPGAVYKTSPLFVSLDEMNDPSWNRFFDNGGSWTTNIRNQPPPPPPKPQEHVFKQPKLEKEKMLANRPKVLTKRMKKKSNPKHKKNDGKEASARGNLLSNLYQSNREPSNNASVYESSLTKYIRPKCNPSNNDEPSVDENNQPDVKLFDSPPKNGKSDDGEKVLPSERRKNPPTQNLGSSVRRRSPQEQERILQAWKRICTPKDPKENEEIEAYLASINWT